MRIEIINNSNAANSLSVLNENLSAMISQSETTLSSLQTIKQFSYSMNGGVGSLQNAVDSVSSRMEQEETTKNNLIAVRTKLEEFLTTVQTIDAEVSEKVTQNEEEFYRVTGWKKPAGVTDLDKWFDAMLYNRMSANLTTLQYELMKLLSSVTNQGNSVEAMKNAAGSVTPTSVRAAATILTMLPIICLYPFLQRYFVTGLTIGGVKE